MTPLVRFIYLVLYIFFLASSIESRTTQIDKTAGISIFVAAFNIKAFGVSKMSDPEIAYIIKEVRVTQHNLKQIYSL